MLTDKETEYCGKVEAHDYELYRGVNGIDHTKTKARLFIADSVGTTLKVNRMYEQLTGIRKEEIKGRNVRALLA